jgi:hypothetical protein
VIGDEKSTLYAGATSFNEVVLDSDLAGGMAMHIGLEFTLDLGFFKEVMKALKKAKDTSTYFGLVSSSQIVKCCQNLSIISSSLMLKRKGNNVAHTNAKLALCHHDSI